MLRGLVGPAGSFFPATWLNEEVLLRALGVPAPVLRSLVGLVLLVAMMRALEVFEGELDQRIEAMQQAQSLANERELEILARLAEGKTNREIAQELFLSHKTVRNYVSTVLQKLGTTNRTEAAAYAIRHHLHEYLSKD